jgi:Mg2+ and Co2+ transporter CorA
VLRGDCAALEAKNVQNCCLHQENLQEIREKRAEAKVESEKQYCFCFLKKKKEREREETITMYLFFGVSRVTDIHEIHHAGRILLLEFGRDPHARSS